MKRFKAYELYRLGGVRALRDLTLDMSEDEVQDACFLPIIALRQFELNPEYAALKGAVQQSKEVRESISRFWRNYRAKKADQGDLNLLQSALVKFENVLEYELAERQIIWSVEKVGIFDSNDLIEHAEDHLSESAKGAMSERSLQDFRAAGRCLAFQLFTASGYHSLRVLEAMARRFHKAVMELPAEEDKPLGPIINDLRGRLKTEEGKESSDSPLGLIIANLARMNNIYRKPLTHPEMIIQDEEEAREVFNLVTASITLMERNLTERGIAPPMFSKVPDK